MSTAPELRPAFRTDIEGLRGVAVLLVVLFHAAAPGFSGGYIGVDVFFVLSGYLITWLLVREAEATGRIDLPAFYARRFRRLLPAVLFLLVAVMGFAYLFYSPIEQGPIAKTALATAAYFSNFHFGHLATDYFAGRAERDPLLHTWSLSVEEQFYLVWPVLVILALTGLGRWSPSRGRLLAIMGAVAAVSFGLMIWLQSSIWAQYAFFSSPARAWEFAIGGLGALIPVRSRFTQPLGWLGLAALLVAGTLYTSATPFPGWTALAPALGTVFVLRAGRPGSDAFLSKALSWRPLRELGRLSYSWYLWHWPVLVFAAGLSFVEIHELPALQRLGLVLLSLVLAEGSYRLVENPVRHLPALSVRPARGIAFGAATTFAGVALAFGLAFLANRGSLHPDQAAIAAAKKYQNECLEKIGKRETFCVLGDTASTSTVFLVGDSHAYQWRQPLETIAEQEGWRLVVATMAACPPVDATRWYAYIGRYYAECDEFRERLFARVTKEQPDLIVMSSYHGPYDGVDRDEWLPGSRRYLQKLGSAGASVLLLTDVVAPEFDLPACLSRARWMERWGGPVNDESCSYPASNEKWADLAALQAKAAQGLTFVRIVDLNPTLCSGERCEPIRAGVMTFRDDDHMSVPYLRTLTPILLDALDTEELPITSVSQRTGR